MIYEYNAYNDQLVFDKIKTKQNFTRRMVTDDNTNNIAIFAPGCPAFKNQSEIYDCIASPFLY